MSHTPGPWVIFSDKGNAIAVMPAGRRGDICCFPKDQHNQTNANARLIAAAPEMLEVLKNVERTLREDHKHDDTLDGCLMVIQAAIAKAEGK